ncbi:MAG: phytanoyl-CoA dioxygenase family protein, partial [Ktedonobacteraceae bacterium]|nr:phytanoyl-CoA dioxygenase family protein [Ktedonobacteraceae bacterium]
MHSLTLPLTSNGFQLSSEPHRLGWLEPTDAGESVKTLREQIRSQGYLWLKGFFKRDEVLALRRSFFAHFADRGLLADGSDPVEGIFSGKKLSSETIHRIWMESVRLPFYETFCTGPRIWRFYEAFLGGEIYLHKRKILRFTVPGDPDCTGGHYDLVYLRAGTDQVCTSWIPLGDTPVELGGLTYLEGSDALGRKLEAEFTRKNADLPPEERISAYNKNMASGGWISKDLPTLADMINGRWLIADYEAGDMVIHSPYIIHASTAN